MFAHETFRVRILNQILKKIFKMLNLKIMGVVLLF